MSDRILMNDSIQGYTRHMNFAVYWAPPKAPYGKAVLVALFQREVDAGFFMKKWGKTMRHLHGKCWVTPATFAFETTVSPLISLNDFEMPEGLREIQP